MYSFIQVAKTVNDTNKFVIKFESCQRKCVWICPVSLFSTILGKRCLEMAKIQGLSWCLPPPPLKYGGDFFSKKCFYRGTKVLGKTYGGGFKVLLYMGGLIIRSCQAWGGGGGSFVSNLSTANLKNYGL